MDAVSDVTRDITYAGSGQTIASRSVIRLLENTTGRKSLIRRARGYEDEVARGRSFWQVIPEKFGLSLDIVGGSLENLPKDGPLVVTSNHPYGILDGLMLGYLLDARRGDFHILANAVFKHVPALDRVLLPISFDATKEATRLNLESRATALNYLAQGGAIGVFPGGTVSTSARPFGPPMDPVWRNFTARMVAKSGATVVPIFFDGHNSRFFQLASRLHYSLRLALLIKEFRARTDAPVRVVIGKPIPQSTLAPHYGDATAMMETLRRATYALSPKPLQSYDPGYEFEDRYKSRDGAGRR